MYDIEPDVVEKNSLENDYFKEVYGFHRLLKTKQDFKRGNRFNFKTDQRRNVRLRNPLNIGEKVLILSERLKKKDAPGFFYKSTTVKRSFFNKEKKIIKRKRIQQTTDRVLSPIEDDNIGNKRYHRQELFALNNQSDN